MSTIKPTITYEDFDKVDLRVALILEATPIPDTDKLMKLKVDLGFEQREIVAGIKQFFTPETLVGRSIIIVANLAPRKMRGTESHGMLLAASFVHADQPQLMLASFGNDANMKPTPGTEIH
jgi:methionyl-tRNA synthetase